MPSFSDSAGAYGILQGLSILFHSCQQDVLLADLGRDKLQGQTIFFYSCQRNLVQSLALDRHELQGHCIVLHGQLGHLGILLELGIHEFKGRPGHPSLLQRRLHEVSLVLHLGG